MAEFDPYLKWLGIRESTRPINHYRLLGLELLEDDPDVIAMAADRQMAHVRTYQNGPHGERSQQLLNELARARRCLLTPDQKREYDQQLQSESTESTPAVPVAVPVSKPTGGSTTTDIGIDVDVDHAARSKRRRREKSQLMWGIVSWISGGVAALGVAAYLISAGVIPWGNAAQNGPAVADSSDVSADGESDRQPQVDSPIASIDDNQPPKRDDDPQPADPPSKIDARPDPGSALPLDSSEPPTVIRGPILPPPTRWTLGNSSSYPAPEPAIAQLIEKVESEIRAGQTSRTVASNPDAQQPEFEQLRSAGQLLIGFRFCVNQALELARVQPIYLTRDGIVAGDQVGGSTNHTLDWIADPGYAVGAIKVTNGHPIQGMQILFRKLDQNGFVGDGTDPQQAYWTPWVGRQDGPYQLLHGDKRQPVVGVFGNADNQAMASLGLIVLGTGETVAMTPSVDPFAPDAPGQPGNGTTETPGEDPRTPIPDPSQQQIIAAQLATDYAADINVIQRRHDIGFIRRFAARLRDTGARESDANRRYMLWESAVRYFALGGDAKGVVEMLQTINEEYQVDFWRAIQQSLGAAVSRVPANEGVVFKSVIDDLIRDAVEAREFDAAQNLLDGAQKLAGDANQLRAWYRQREDNVKQLKQLIKDYDEVLADLRQNPDDPQANTVAGEYFFIVQRDLEQAVQHWSKATSKSLEKIARLEIEIDRNDPAQVLELANNWERLGQGRSRTLRRIYASERALELYQSVVDSLEGAEQQRVLEEIESLKSLLAE